MTDRVLAVVVSYNPDINVLTKLLDSLSSQVEQVVVVDNGSANQAELSTLLAEQAKQTLLSQAENLGLGAAHNLGINFAVEQSFTHVLLLDQDSLPEADMVAQLLKAYCAAENVEPKVAAVGATFVNTDNGSKSFFVKFGRFKFQRFYCDTDQDCGTQKEQNLIEADCLISSGCLMSVASLQEIGGMDESLFIDHVDTEWFLRAQNKGFKVYGCCDALMYHKLGEKTHRVKLIRERNVPQHKPFRYYYTFRNSVLLYKRGYCSWQWKFNDLQRLLSIVVMYGLICPPRWQNFQMMVKGVWHGLLGKSGKMVG